MRSEDCVTGLYHIICWDFKGLTIWNNGMMEYWKVGC